MLTTRRGRAIRFPATDVRVFKGRDFDRRARHPARGGRRGGLDGGHPPLRGHARRARGLSQDAPRRRRRARGGGRGRRGRGGRRGRRQLRARPGPLRRDVRGRGSAADDHRATAPASSRRRHDYPVRGRGGQGVAAMDRAMRGGPLVALFPVEHDDQIMLATDAGQSIRVPVAGISFRSRGAAACGSSTPPPASTWSRSRWSPRTARTRARRSRARRPTALLNSSHDCMRSGTGLSSSLISATSAPPPTRPGAAGCPTPQTSRRRACACSRSSACCWPSPRSRPTSSCRPCRRWAARSAPATGTLQLAISAYLLGFALRPAVLGADQRPLRAARAGGARRSGVRHRLGRLRPRRPTPGR